MHLGCLLAHCVTSPSPTAGEAYQHKFMSICVRYYMQGIHALKLCSVSKAIYIAKSTLTQWSPQRPAVRSCCLRDAYLSNKSCMTPFCLSHVEPFCVKTPPHGRNVCHCTFRHRFGPSAKPSVDCFSHPKSSGELSFHTKFAGTLNVCCPSILSHISMTCRAHVGFLCSRDPLFKSNANNPRLCGERVMMRRHSSSPQYGTNDVSTFSKKLSFASTTCVVLSTLVSHSLLKMLSGDVMNVCPHKELPNATNVHEAVVRCMKAGTRVTLLFIETPCLEQIFCNPRQV